MASIPLSQARQLSHCDVQPSLFDDLVTDNFLRLLPVEQIEGDCYRIPLITSVDKPTNIGYVTGGGAINDVPVGYSGAGEFELGRIVTRATVSGDILANVSQINDVLEDQSLAMSQLLVEKVGQLMWQDPPDPSAPAGMPDLASSNPLGVGTPVQGSGEAMKLPDDLLCLRERQSPWNPSSPQYYVMNSKLYYQVLEQAWAKGTNLVEFGPDSVTGETMPHVMGVPIVASDHISLDENGSGTTSVYLVRAGRGATDPQKIEGVKIVTPMTRPHVEIGRARPDSGNPDDYFVEVSWDLAFSGGSVSSVARTQGFAP